MQKLLYHSKNSENNESVFDKAISEICTNSAIKLVSPYIGIDYLQRITALSVNWKLISDVNEWLSSSSSGDRLKIADFIKSNFEKIHHYNDLHAKVVIGQDKAYLGSANLTSSGLLRRTEMGILIADEILLQELNAWFDENWLDTVPPDLQEINIFIKESIDAPVAKEQLKTKIQSKGKIIRKKFSTEQIEPKVANEDSYLNIRDLIESVLDEIEKEKKFSLSYFFVIPKIAKSGFNQQELLDELLYFTANSCKTIFSLKNINRLVLQGEEFLFSTEALVLPIIDQYDQYLLEIISGLSFNKSMPLEEFTEKLKIPFDQKKHLIQSLFESEFLILPKTAPINLIALSDIFDWNNRFRLFKRSVKSWHELKEKENESILLFNTTKAAGIYKNALEKADEKILQSLKDGQFKPFSLSIFAKLPRPFIQSLDLRFNKFLPCAEYECAKRRKRFNLKSTMILTEFLVNPSVIRGGIEIYEPLPVKLTYLSEIAKKFLDWKNLRKEEALLRKLASGDFMGLIDALKLIPSEAWIKILESELEKASISPYKIPPKNNDQTQEKININTAIIMAQSFCDFAEENIKKDRTIEKWNYLLNVCKQWLNS